MLCRYCDMPQDVKNSLPRVDWAARKILGYEVNRVPGEPACCASGFLAVQHGIGASDTPSG